MQNNLFKQIIYYTCPRCGTVHNSMMPALECCNDIEIKIVYACCHCSGEYSTVQKAAECHKIEKQIREGKQKTLI